MKSLIELLTGQTDITVYGNQEIFILDIQQDSRLVKSGSLFVAQKGLLSDGHLFIAFSSKTKTVREGKFLFYCSTYNFNIY